MLVIVVPLDLLAATVMPSSTFSWVLSCSDGKTRRGKLEHDEWADLTLEEALQKLDEVVPEIPRDKRRLVHLGKILNKEWIHKSSLS